MPRPPGRPRQISVAQAAVEENERQMFMTMRDRIAVAIDDPETSPSTLVNLTKRLEEIVAKIAALDAKSGGSVRKAVDVPDDEDFDGESF